MFSCSTDPCSSSFSSTTHRKSHSPAVGANNNNNNNNNNAIIITKKSKMKSTHLNLNLSGMVNKLISSSSASKAAKGRSEFTGDDITNNNNFIIPTTKRSSSSNSGGGLVGLIMHKKLFGDKKALATSNSRSLGMVLKSERELLNVNKEQEAPIIQRNSILVQKNTEIDKLKDLCLKQREEIKSLKTAILFPAQDRDHKESSLMLSSSMSLQMQVKSDKYSVQGSYDDGLVTSPNLTHDHEEATNSLVTVLSTTPGSPDDMFLSDLNPCLTPYVKSKSKDFEYIESHSSSYNSTTRCHEVGFGSHGRKL